MNRNKNSEKEQQLRIERSIQSFKELLTGFVSPDELRRVFTQLYFNYSRYLIHFPDDYRYDSLEHLFYLNQLIELLEPSNFDQNINLGNGQELRIERSAQEFSELITYGISPDQLEQQFNELYFNYSQFVIKHPDEYSFKSDEHLFYLWRFIEILRNADFNPKDITQFQKARLNNFFNPVKIESPEEAILEISGNRTTQVDGLSFMEAKALLDRFSNVNQTQILIIKNTAQNKFKLST